MEKHQNYLPNWRSTVNILREEERGRSELEMQSTSSDTLAMHNGLRVEPFFTPVSENETDTDSDSGAFTAHRRRKSNAEDTHRLSTPEMIRHAFNIAVIKVRYHDFSLAYALRSNTLNYDIISCAHFLTNLF